MTLVLSNFSNIGVLGNIMFEKALIPIPDADALYDIHLPVWWSNFEKYPLRLEVVILKNIHSG